MSRSKVIDILGKYLTPALVVSIFGIIISSLREAEIHNIPMDQTMVFLESLRSGYYTQDLIAAVFFGSALIGMLNISEESQSETLKKTWYGGLIAAFMLAILYTALMAASAVHAKDLQNLSDEKLVSKLAYLALGGTFGGLSSIAVSLACLTTEIALVLVFADFLKKNIFINQSYKRSVFVTMLTIWLMSQLHYNGIMAIISPAMQVIYPILFFLVLRILYRFRHDFSKRSNSGC
jgi:LIVCS family branched-chain amino acid:cation transporter